MELCTTARAISYLPHHRPFTLNHTHLPWNFSLPLSQTSVSRKNPGLLYYTNSSLKSRTSEETSSGASQYVKEEPDGVMTMDEDRSVEKSEFDGSGVAKEDTPMDDQMQLFNLLDKLNIEDLLEAAEGITKDFPIELGNLSVNLDEKLDSEDFFPILLFGGGGLAALWLATAVVGAIDSIPAFPKLMEVLGLGYTLWFSTRYLLFKKNRDELATKVEEIKQLVVGSKDD